MDKQASVQPKKKLHFSIGQIVTLVIFGIGLLWLIITLILPLLIGDGLSRYTGAKLEAAKNAINNPQDYIDNKLRWAYSFHVDEVRPVSAAEITQSCHEPSYITKDINNLAYYTVIVSQRQLLQFGSEVKTYIGCDSVSQY